MHTWFCFSLITLHSQLWYQFVFVTHLNIHHGSHFEIQMKKILVDLITRLSCNFILNPSIRAIFLGNSDKSYESFFWYSDETSSLVTILTLLPHYLAFHFFFWTAFLFLQTFLLINAIVLSLNLIEPCGRLTSCFRVSVFYSFSVAVIFGYRE